MVWVAGATGAGPKAPDTPAMATTSAATAAAAPDVTAMRSALRRFRLCRIQLKIGPLTTSFQWLLPTPAHLAQLKVSVPAGFHQVTPPARPVNG